ncbi:MAG: tetratricopeptide repeat protein [Acidobacteria bacterium]|nr:tetratricopeptide repeat protein [Acidobacteriota bacterium]
MKRPLLLMALWLLAMVPAGFAQSREIIQLQQSVALLQGMVRELQRSFDEKTAVLRALLEQSTERTNQVSNEVSTTVSTLQNVVQTSVGNASQKVDNINTQVLGLQASLDDLRARLDRLSQQVTKIESASQTISSMGSLGGMGEGMGAPPPAPDVLYNTALRDYTSGNYPLSLQEFTDYLRYFANTPLASNAQFYIGDIYYQQGQFEKAIQEYDKAIEQYPNGNKTAAAQLKKGFALLNMNLRTQGVQELNNLIKRFPNTPEASLAQDRISSLGPEPSGGSRRR